MFAFVAVLLAPAGTSSAAGGELSGRTPLFLGTHTLYRTQGGRDLNLEVVELLASRGEIPERVAEIMGSPEQPQVLIARSQVVADNNLGTIEITVRDEDPAFVVALADAHAQAILESLRAEPTDDATSQVAALDQRAAGLADRVRELDGQITALPTESTDASLLIAERDAVYQQFRDTVALREQLRFGSGAGIDEPGLFSLQTAVAIPQQALSGSGDASSLPVPRSRAARGLIGFVLGALLGGAAALLMDRYDTRLRTRQGAEAAFGLPVVAEVPRLTREQQRARAIVMSESPASFEAEGYRVLRISAQLMSRWVLPTTMTDDPEVDLSDVQRDELDPLGEKATIVVTSASPSSGKTATAINLAASFAEIGRRVILLDCDFAGSDMGDWLDLPSQIGVGDYLSDSKHIWTVSALLRESSIDGVKVATSGSPKVAPGRLSGPTTRLLAEAHELADVVIVDTGPALSAPETSAFVTEADAVILVARAGHTSRREARRLSQLMARLEARLLGIALVAVPRHEMQASYRASSARFGSPRLPKLPLIGRRG